MHAVIRTGGKQYRVSEGETLRVEKLDVEAGKSIDIDEVLLVSDGDTAQIGTPLVDGGKVTAEVQGHGRGDKIDVIKFKRRKKYRRKQGHRQDYTELKVTGIAGLSGGAKKAKKAAEPAAPKQDDQAEAPAGGAANAVAKSAERAADDAKSTE